MIFYLLTFVLYLLMETGHENLNECTIINMRMLPVFIIFIVFLSSSFIYGEDEKILHAVKNDDTFMLQSLLDYPDKVNQLYDDKVLLHYAVRKASQKSIRYLINYDADVNRLHNKKSPLIIAIQKKKSNIAELLIELY